MAGRSVIVLVLTVVLLAACGPALAAPSFQQIGGTLVMSNANVTVNYNLGSGTASFYWRNSEKISAFYAGVALGSGYVEGVNFSNRTWSVVGSDQVAVSAFAAGQPEMIQYFTLDQTDSFLTRVAMSGSRLSANWMGPVVVSTTGGVNIGITNDNRALFVPFDNDGFVSYNSEPMNGSDTGNEVGAFYDNVSRNGLVVGSVTHDTWKTGVFWSGSNNKLNQLNVFGGVTDHWTWDVMPHGSVSGNVISSPTIFVGFNDDWRIVMENFANENALFVPRLAWTNGVPFGWNSWGVTNYQNHLTYDAAVAVSDSIHTNLQPYGFANGGTVYVNLDAFWNNLNSFQLQSFVNHCHANGQKAGIYFGPFAWFGSVNSATNTFVEGSTNLYRYSDLLLRDSNGNPESIDGGLALDPTHPADRDLINYYIDLYTNYGFDYVKLDFLSHGALEGVHYDTNVTTGIEAYNEGMSNVLRAINGRMFISESIAPIFPYQYADSRRIACDAQASEIGNTEYTMNAVSLGWWISGRLYPFNDPDLLVFDNGPDTNEVQSRLINGVITGLVLNGSILTNAASVGLAQQCLTNAAIDAVARLGQTFRPVDGAAGTGAGNIFVRQNGQAWYIAVFNYTGNATNETVDLTRAGLPPGTYIATNLWNGAASTVTGSFTVSLNEKQARLFELVVPVVAQNENVTWQSPVAVSGPSDVSTQGSYFGSWAPYSSSPLTVNGVSFQNFTDLPGFGYTGFNAGYTSFPDPETEDENYNTLLECGAYEYPGPACSFSWGGMTPGHTYLIELWVNGNDPLRTETLTGGTNTSGTIDYEPGQYVIGAFTANGPGQETIMLNGESGDDYPQVNLVQVRDITVAGARPVISSARASGSSLILNGTDGTAGGAYSVLTSTNLAASLANWTPVASNVYDSSGNFSVTNVLSHNNPAQFYIIKQP